MEIFSTIGALFQTLFVHPITNLLVLFYSGLFYVQVPYALGFGIVALTIFIRLILYPLTSAQIKSTKVMQELAPEISKLRERFKNDRTRQQQELMSLYKKNGVNPASGCLPLLIQIPIIWSLYNVLVTLFAQSASETVARINEIVYHPILHINQPWSTIFFGIDLSIVPQNVFSQNPAYVLVAVVTGILQFILSKMMISLPTDDAKKKKKNDDFQTIFQKQSVYIFPFMIGYFSFIFPVGLSLYWNTFTLFGILQQYLLVGPGGLEPWLKKIQTK